jgi:arabinose-5-phosphate isomerase
LKGVFTDGDLRRLITEKTNFQQLNIGQIMTKSCYTISLEKPAVAAVQIMDEFNLSALPVIDKNNQIKGVINTHTLMQANII